MSDSLLQDWKDAVQRRVGGLQRLCKFLVEGDGLAEKSVSGRSAGVTGLSAYARAWSPVDSMLEDGAQHRAPMTGSLVTEQCERSDVNVVISGECGRAGAIHSDGELDGLERTARTVPLLM